MVTEQDLKIRLAVNEYFEKNDLNDINTIDEFVSKVKAIELEPNKTDAKINRDIILRKSVKNSTSCRVL